MYDFLEEGERSEEDRKGVEEEGQRREAEDVRAD